MTAPNTRTRASQKVRKASLSGNKISGGEMRPIVLTERDILILEALHHARYLNTPQIQALFWRETQDGKSGRQKACQRRLRKLLAVGLIRRIEQPVRRTEASKPYIYAIDKDGAKMLIDLGVEPREVEWRPKPAEANYPFLAHLLATTDIRIAVQQACEQRQFDLEVWMDEKELKSEGMKTYVTLRSPNGKRQRAAIVPDAFFTIHDAAIDKRAIFFVEVDKGSVTIVPTVYERRGFARKVRAFVAYFESDAYRKRYDGRTARVLIVTTSDKRLTHLKQATEDAGGGPQFWFTTFACASADKILFNHIWQVAGSEECFPLFE